MVTKKGNLTQNGVHLKPHEYETVKLFLNLGHDVELIPFSKIHGLRLPDIMMDGVAWEIKSPVGDGKHTMQNTVQNASHQSNSIIVDLQRCKTPESQAIKELKHHFQLSKRIRRMKIVTRSKEILDFSK